MVTINHLSAVATRQRQTAEALGKNPEHPGNRAEASYWKRRRREMEAQAHREAMADLQLAIQQAAL